jgi:poly(hydroxyalkanoate) depolymerase family esterase
MLHGCTQSPDDFASGTRMNFLAEERNCFVVYPEQPSGANQSKCWNWFRPSHQQRDGGEPSLIAGITQQIMRDYSIDPNRVYIAGLSAGGAAAAIMAATYQDLYAAAGIHSGLVCGAARDLPSALVAMRQGGRSEPAHGIPVVPTIVFHGDRDTTVHPTNGERIFQQGGNVPRSKAQVIKGLVPRGHAYTRTIMTDPRGMVISEHWNVHGAGHAWSGGSPAGSYTDPNGPDATREMLRFFLEHPLLD